MDPISSLGWLAFLAPVALFWQQTKNIISQVLALFVRNDAISFCSGDEATSFVEFLATKGKLIQLGNVKFFETAVYSLTHGKYCNNMFRNRSKFIFLIRGWFPILVTPVNGDPARDVNITYFNIRDFAPLLREFNLQRIDRDVQLNTGKEAERVGPGFFMLECKGKSLKNLKGSTRSTGHDSSDNDDSIPRVFGSGGGSGGGSSKASYFGLPRRAENKIIPSICLPHTEVEYYRSLSAKSKFYFSTEGSMLLEDVANWLGKKSWYVDRDIVWRRGVLLYGAPGTGKSALVKEVAKKLKLPVYYMDLGTMDDQEFDHMITRYVDEGGQIILFEDIDAVFEGRVNKLKSGEYGGLSFDYFINRLSGINAIPNTYIVITTNHKEQLDPALLRDGRVDNQIELGFLSLEGKRFIAEKMLDLWPDLIDGVITDDPETAAMFENRVTKIALTQIWKE